MGNRFKNYFKNKNLNSCSWSVDPRKRYNQIMYYIGHRDKYDLDYNDLVKLVDLKKDAWNKMLGKKGW